MEDKLRLREEVAEYTSLRAYVHKVISAHDKTVALFDAAISESNGQLPQNTSKAVHELMADAEEGKGLLTTKLQQIESNGPNTSKLKRVVTETERLSETLISKMLRRLRNIYPIVQAEIGDDGDAPIYDAISDAEYAFYGIGDMRDEIDMTNERRNPRLASLEENPTYMKLTNLLRESPSDLGEVKADMRQRTAAFVKSRFDDDLKEEVYANPEKYIEMVVDEIKDEVYHEALSRMHQISRNKFEEGDAFDEFIRTGIPSAADKVINTKQSGCRDDFAPAAIVAIETLYGEELKL